MSARSWLFVPGDSERKQARALDTAADALILDLEDSVAAAQRGAARKHVLARLRERRGQAVQQLWVRVNGAASGELLEDLVAVMPGGPYGIVLPKVSSRAELCEVDHYLSALERREGLLVGSTQLLAIVTETPQSLLRLGDYAGASARLAAFTWGAEDLSAALGARAAREADGTWSAAFQLARSLCLLGAAAARVQAVDGVYADFNDAEGLAEELQRARRDGFTGKLAIHPGQIAPINAAFTPTEAELAQARRIVAAFAAEPGLGVTSLDGRMIDRPHLLQAERLLELAARLQPRGSAP
ncbi:MAG TPA: CoA ester lyase [Steroidobacteraceae bacterium]|nr:CoA ester lyase [Steroidobacteraceae bacterium]